MTFLMSTVATKMYFNGGIPSFCGCNLDLLPFSFDCCMFRGNPRFCLMREGRPPVKMSGFCLVMMFGL